MTARRFEPGDHVHVLDRDKPGHVRTPRYVRGKTGRIVTAFGDFRNPESLAYGGSGLPKSPLYKVEFRQVDLWGERAERPDDALQVDIFEHWLEPARREEG